VLAVCAIASRRESTAMGNERYVYFWVMCHGSKADGGGEVFYKICFGFRRHPLLIYTVAGMTAGSLSIIAASFEKADIPSPGKPLSKAIPYPLR
jgi:hypothetical protein